MSDEKTAKASFTAKPWIFLGCLVVLLIVGFASGAVDALADIAHWDAFQTLVQENLPLALLLYFACTVVGCAVLAVPGVVFAIAAGMLFGPVLGTAACVLSATVGAVGAFVAGRYFLRDSIKPKIVAHPLLKKWLFDEAGTNVAVLLAVTRLVPLFPFNLQNFAYGITDISLGAYTGLSFLFMIPGTAMYAVAAAGAVDEGNRLALFAVAALIALAVFALGLALRKRYVDGRAAGSRVACDDRKNQDTRNAGESATEGGCCD